MTAALHFDDVVTLIGDRLGTYDAPCPLCGPDRRTPANQRRRVLRLYRTEPKFISYCCARCGEHGFVYEGGRNAGPIDRERGERHRMEAAERDRNYAARQLLKARYLWALRRPTLGTAAETYLRGVRCYGGPIPATLAFLPSRGKFPPAVIAAFGIPHEPEPGVLEISDDAVQGVQIIRLLPDGSDRDRSDGSKISLGSCSGFPIVLAAANDHGGLAICEGIEDALSIHEATGLGAWAAGGASRLPALADAVPDYIEAVSISVDDNEAGRSNSHKLAEALLARASQGILVRGNDRDRGLDAGEMLRLLAPDDCSMPSREALKRQIQEVLGPDELILRWPLEVLLIEGRAG